MKQIYTYLLAVIGLSSLYGQYGDIPASRMAPSGWQNIQYNDPGGWTTINVTQNGLPANDSSVDAGQKIEDIVASTSGRRRLYFPAGTYTFKTTAIINVGDIWIDGDGMDSTIFNLDFPKFQKRDGIVIKGGVQGTAVDIVGTPNRGDNQITVTNASQFQVGDYIRVKYPYTASDGDVVDVGQIVKVTAKAGTTLTIDLKIGVDFGSGGEVREMDFAENVRVTDLTINRLRLGDRWEDNLRLNQCRNFQVKNVESIKSTTYGIRAFQCRDGIISECEVHERWGNEGGYAYGIAATALSTRIHITNNYLYNLRHHIELAKSPNHCVISYNVTDPLYAYSDIGAHHGDESHNNLFEGNDGRQIVMALDAHAKAWWNTFYRNRADGTVGSQSSQFETTTIVGNETPSISFSGSNNYKGSNIVNGVFQADSLPAGSNLPASLYLSSQPSYVASWPLFGPGSGGGGGTTYQAENYNSASGVSTESNDGGTVIRDWASGDYVVFNNVNFPAGTTSIDLRLASGSSSSPAIEVRKDSNTGTLLGSMNVTASGWNTFNTQTLGITSTSGSQTLYFISPNGGIKGNWFRIGTTTTQLEAYNAGSGVSTASEDGGTVVRDWANGDFIVFQNFDFGSGTTSIDVRVASGSGSSPTLEARLGSASGTLIGTLNASTGGWSTYQTKTMNLTSSQSGTKTVYFVSPNGGIKVNWFEL